MLIIIVTFKVRNFHKKFYRPENLTIILTGQIEAEEVFKAVAIVEDDIIAKVKNEHFFKVVKLKKNRFHL